MASGPALFGASTYPHLVSSARRRRRRYAQRALSAARDGRWEGLAGEDEVDEAVQSEFTRQQTGALELLLSPPLALHSLSYRAMPAGDPWRRRHPVQHRSYLHTRVSGWVISSSPVKRFLNRCTSPHHTPEHTLKTLQFSQRETRERETRRGEEASEVQEREGRGERASVLRRWPQPPVIVASSTSFFLSRSRQATKPRRRLRLRRQPVQHRCALPQPY